jgi:hypothetical protein
MPSAAAVAKVTGKETNPPSRAADIAGSTSSTSCVGSRKSSGAMRMPPRPAMAPPSAQFAVAIRSGECPSVAATRCFSATAVVTRPKEVRL